MSDGPADVLHKESIDGNEFDRHNRFQREIEAAKSGNQNPESDQVVDGSEEDLDSIPVVSKMPLSLRESSELPHVSSAGTVDGLSNNGISSLFDDP